MIIDIINVTINNINILVKINKYYQYRYQLFL